MAFSVVIFAFISLMTPLLIISFIFLWNRLFSVFWNRRLSLFCFARVGKNSKLKLFLLSEKFFMENGIRQRGKGVLVSIAFLCTNMVNNIHNLIPLTLRGCRESSDFSTGKIEKHFRMIHVTFPWLFIISFRQLLCSQVRLRWWEWLNE